MPTSHQQDQSDKTYKQSDEFSPTKRSGPSKRDFWIAVFFIAVLAIAIFSSVAILLFNYVFPYLH